MFNIENDDMDDLFREAADKYQLDSGPAVDWEKINRALHETQDGKVLPITDLKNTGENNRKYFWIFLCILLILPGWLADYFWADNIKNAVSENIQNITTKKENSKTAIFDFKNKQPQINNGNYLQNKIFNGNDTVVKSSAKNETSHKKDLWNTFQGRYSDFYEKPLVSNDAGMDNSLNNNPVLNEETTLNNPNMLSLEKQNDINIIIANNNPVTGSTIKDSKNDSVINRKISPKKHIARFYAGIVASPEFTFIKSQKSEAGNTFGVIGGYNLNSHWSVETGFLFDKKNYYTAGEYFNKSKIQYLNNVDLISADGDCNMLEIPVNVRYKLTSKNKRSSWSASVGTSTYLMKKEHYKYYFLNYGSSGEGSQAYYNSSNDLFAVLNFGLGYEKKISKSVFLRIEPYLKTSIKGVGIARLPMSAAGINVGAIVPLR